MELKPGTRLRSQVDDTEVIVVRGPSGATGLTCGGHPMVGKDEERAALTARGDGGGTLLGKRYTLAGGGDLEILVTRPGEAGLALGGAPLTLKEARPLPASD